MQYMFLNGQVAIMVRYCVERYEQVDGGARIDVRRAEPYEGHKHREGAHGYRVLPVGDGGIYRIDLSIRLDDGSREQRYHHHPHFQDGDVGPRAYDEGLAADPVGWSERQLRNLPKLLTEKGYPELAESIDIHELEKAMPMIRMAIESSLQP
ncbi:hypothetical protein AB0J86_05145 [Micromonospora sp. NPDC049559]|uniref:DUF7700 domain-containing protein n=1 Tax=Micromonospora sp. NPDC049559 TaxID=3155923 RepID=UPI0034417C2C